MFPAASRNAGAILAVLASYVPATGRALEIASGSGQHIARYAHEFPGITWQPSEVDPVKIASIESWRRETGADNLAAPLSLNATAAGWAADHEPFDLIILVNLLHLISSPETESLIAETAKALAPGGLLLIYGPFLRGEGFASTGDEAFHRSLTAQDPAIGYKSHQSIRSLQRSAGLRIEATHEMPANNLMLVARKP